MTGPDLPGIRSNAYLSGRLTPSTVAVDTLARIAAADEALCSFTAVDAGRARRAAAVADTELKSGSWRGPLHGVPIAVKELFDVEGLPATYGSRARAGALETADAGIIRRLPHGVGHLVLVREAAGVLLKLRLILG